METKSPDLDKTADESLTAGEETKSTSSDISLTDENTEGEERTDKKVKPANISPTLLSSAQSTTVRCTAGKQVTASCSGPFHPTMPEKGEDVFHQAKETAASSNLSLCVNTVSVCEEGTGGTKALDASSSSLTSTTPIAAAESEGKDSGQDSVPTVPTIPTACKIKDKEIDVTSVSSTWDAAASIANRIHNFFEPKTSRENISQTFADNKSNNDVSNLLRHKCLFSETTSNNVEANTISTAASSEVELRKVGRQDVLTSLNTTVASADSARGRDIDYGAPSTSAGSHPPLTAGRSDETGGNMKKSENEDGIFDSSNKQDNLPQIPQDGKLPADTTQSFQYEPGQSDLAQSSARTDTSATSDARETSEITVRAVTGSAIDVRGCNEQDFEAASDDKPFVTPSTSLYASAELPPAEHQSSGEYIESDTTPLPQKKI